MKRLTSGSTLDLEARKWVTTKRQRFADRCSGGGSFLAGSGADARSPDEFARAINGISDFELYVSPCLFERQYGRR
ncbi:MAG: hypothetical protein U1E25_14610 [Methylocystis sp.]